MLQIHRTHVLLWLHTALSTYKGAQDGSLYAQDVEFGQVTASALLAKNGGNANGMHVND